MLIFLERKLAIYAPPKTGTTALHMALGPHADIALRGPAKHFSVRRAKKLVLPMLEGLDTPLPEGFAVIREPIEWLHSWYRYRTRKEVPEGKSSAHLSFDAFVESYLSDDPETCAKLGKQSRFCAGEGPLSIVHHFAHEHMDRAVGFLSDRLEIEFALDWVNESPTMPLELSSPNRAKLLDHFKDDYRIYEHALKNSLRFEPPR